MIAYLQGVLRSVNGEEVVLMVGGVGYRVFVPAKGGTVLGGLGQEIGLHTVTHVREDAIHIYGFPTLPEKILFRLLLGVSKVGPRVALNILAAVSPEAFRRAVVFEDLDALTGIAGVGRKTAQRIIMELRDRMDDLGGAAGAEAAAPGGTGHPDAPPDQLFQGLEALAALGYGRSEAGPVLEEQLRRHGREITLEDLVREALKELGRRGHDTGYPGSVGRRI